MPNQCSNLIPPEVIMRLDPSDDGSAFMGVKDTGSIPQHDEQTEVLHEHDESQEAAEAETPCKQRAGVQVQPEGEDSDGVHDDPEDARVDLKQCGVKIHPPTGNSYPADLPNSGDVSLRSCTNGHSSEVGGGNSGQQNEPAATNQSNAGSGGHSGGGGSGSHTGGSGDGDDPSDRRNQNDMGKVDNTQEVDEEENSHEEDDIGRVTSNENEEESLRLQSIGDISLGNNVDSGIASTVSGAPSTAGLTGDSGLGLGQSAATHGAPKPGTQTILDELNPTGIQSHLTVANAALADSTSGGTNLRILGTKNLNLKEYEQLKNLTHTLNIPVEYPDELHVPANDRKVLPETRHPDVASQGNEDLQKDLECNNTQVPEKQVNQHVSVRSPPGRSNGHSQFHKEGAANTEMLSDMDRRANSGVSFRHGASDTDSVNSEAARPGSRDVEQEQHDPLATETGQDEHASALRTEEPDPGSSHGEDLDSGAMENTGDHLSGDRGLTGRTGPITGSSVQANTARDCGQSRPIGYPTQVAQTSNPAVHVVPSGARANVLLSLASLLLLAPVGVRYGSEDQLRTFADSCDRQYPTTQMCGLILSRMRNQLFITESNEYRSGTEWVWVEEIGRGGQATCYLAKDLNTDFNFCVKIMDRFRYSEVDLLLELGDIEGVVDVYGVLQQGNTVFILTQYIGGTNLAEYVQASPEQCLPIVDGLIIMDQLLRILQEIHARNILHNDLKEKNVMIVDVLRSVLIDLGMSCHLVDGLTRRTEGTSLYNSPEKRCGSGHGTPADIYAAMVMFCRIIMPELNSFDLQTLHHLTHLPEDILDFLRRGLDPNPGSRSTAHELLRHRAFRRLNGSNSGDVRGAPSTYDPASDDGAGPSTCLRLTFHSQQACRSRTNSSMASGVPDPGHQVQDPDREAGLMDEAAAYPVYPQPGAGYVGRGAASEAGDGEQAVAGDAAPGLPDFDLLLPEQQQHVDQRHVHFPVQESTDRTDRDDGVFQEHAPQTLLWVLGPNEDIPMITDPLQDVEQDVEDSEDLE